MERFGKGKDRELISNMGKSQVVDLLQGLGRSSYIETCIFVQALLTPKGHSNTFPWVYGGWFNPGSSFKPRYNTSNYDDLTCIGAVSLAVLCPKFIVHRLFSEL